MRQPHAAAFPLLAAVRPHARVPLLPLPLCQVLYSFPGDFRALKAHVAAAYNELTLVRKDLDLAKKEHEEAAFAAKTPLGKLPVLETEAGACSVDPFVPCARLHPCVCVVGRHSV